MTKKSRWHRNGLKRKDIICFSSQIGLCYMKPTFEYNHCHEDVETVLKVI